MVGLGEAICVKLVDLGDNYAFPGNARAQEWLDRMSRMGQRVSGLRVRCT